MDLKADHLAADHHVDSNSAPDLFKTDGSPTLWPCSSPGQPCNAHDPCAVNPLCGTDNLCHPSSLQSCDDNLACTLDVCTGAGLCANEPQAGYCALPVTVGGVTQIQCFTQGAKKPGDSCYECDPANGRRYWTKVC